MHYTSIRLHCTNLHIRWHPFAHFLLFFLGEWHRYISIIECSFRLSTKDNILWRKVQSCVVFHFFNVYFKLREDEKKNLLILVSFIFSVHKKTLKREKKSFYRISCVLSWKNVLKSCTNLNMYFCIFIFKSTCIMLRGLLTRRKNL